MGGADRCSLHLSGTQYIPDTWFDEQVKRYRSSNEILQGYIVKEVEVLKAYYGRQVRTQDAARAITHPISSTSIPLGGTSSDDIVPLTQLWRLLKDALVEWPPDRTPDLVLLLAAIARRRDRIHRGEAFDDDEQPLAWTCLPYLTMIWSEAYWMEPGQIVRRCNGVESRHRARDAYIKQQDAEAQLVAAGVFEWRRAFWYLIKTLERVANHHDNTVASGDDTAEVLLQADFHIPAVACWIKHNGRRLYDEIAKDELKAWDERDVPVEARHFDQPTNRWSFWAERLGKFVRDEPDDIVKRAACHAVQNMEAIAGESRQYNARHDERDGSCIICSTMMDEPRVD
ncbi:hypothetical protein PCL_12684 [Purpureocillium lilacinum]|uniref:Uncharacterized protein n=1 Tax=Purpureocillium lilacinum TaxID=33203 RepID=A0A2U3DPB0_PURLI|nr:hypothetical protein PCL_12684 [Purpureocillium lilacinum]